VAPSCAPQPKRRVLVRFLLAALLFCGLEGAVFRSGFYLRFLEPNSTAGLLQAILNDERLHYRAGPAYVQVLGDSRMALLLRVSDRLAGETGYTFGRIATAGTHPRCWYYMLREVDPDARKYAAVVIPVYTYDDEDWENLADAEVDIHYLAPLLRLSDLFEFSLSFDSWYLRGRAFRTVLFKGLTYKRDLYAFWADPAARRMHIRWEREDGAKARYDFVGDVKTNMTGLAVDWPAHKITHYPDDATPDIRAMLDTELLRSTGNYTGQRTAYLRKWFGKIVERYRGTRTRILFIRLPRGPVLRPYKPYTPTSAVREIAARGDAILMDEHCFDELERPELFHDAVHLNPTGCERFTVILAREVRGILGPPPTR